MGFPIIDPFLSTAGLPTTSDILDWVTGDPQALRDAANGWTEAANKVKDARTDVDSGLQEVMDNWSGEGYQAFAAYMTKVLKELDREAAAMVVLAAKLNSIANALAMARDKVVRILVRLAAALVPLVAISLFPPAGALSLPTGAALTAAAFAAILVITQALSGVLQGVPDVLNDLKGYASTATSLGKFPDALPNGVPLGRWGPQQDEPGAVTRPAPASLAASGGGVSAGPNAPAGAESYGGATAPLPPSVPLAPGPRAAAAAGGAGQGAPSMGMAPALPPGYGWAPAHAPLPAGWHQDLTTGEILPPGAPPSDGPPAGLPPDYGWVAPGTHLPAGWHVDKITDVLVGPQQPNGVEDNPDTGGWEAAMRPGGSAFAHAFT